MANPIKVAKDLHESLNSVIESVVLAPKPKKGLESVKKQVHQIVVFLEKINNHYVPLEIDDLKPDLTEGLVRWQRAPSGVIKNGMSAYDELIGKTETLRILHGAGIDIPSITKFSDKELMFAKSLGGRFEDFSKSLYKFAGCLNNLNGQVGTFYSQVNNSKVDFLFFSLLKDFGVVDKFTIEVYIQSKNSYVDSTFPRLENFRAKKNTTKIRFFFEESELQHFIRGTWFNAYAYHIIDDHLNRNKFEYEIFTQVTYNAPPDIKRLSGDFDIIAMVGNKVLLAECKSGELKKTGDRDDFSKIIEKAEVIRKVFNLTGGDKYENIFLLIYNHYANNSDEVEKNLEETAIQPIKSDQIRGMITNLFSR